MTYWDQYGTSDSPLIDVTDQALAYGESNWPAGRQRYRVVRTWQSLVISSEGLGERELYLEMPGAQGWLPEQARNQWQFEVLRAASRMLAAGAVPADTSLPFVLPVGAPVSAPLQLYSQLSDALVVAVIVGIDVPGRERVSDGVEYLPLTPITAHEFASIYGGGQDTLEQVIAARVEGGFHHVVIDSAEVTDLLDARLPS